MNATRSSRPAVKAIRDERWGLGTPQDIGNASLRVRQEKVITKSGATTNRSPPRLCQIASSHFTRATSWPAKSAIDSPTSVNDLRR